MSAAARAKQALMVVGLLTVIGVLAIVGVLGYLWWDARGVDEEFATSTDFEPEAELEEAAEDGTEDEGGEDAIDDGESIRTAEGTDTATDAEVD